MKKTKEGSIYIKFNKHGQAMFDIKTKEDAQILTAMLGLEAYFAQKTGLDHDAIREILDDSRDKVMAKPRSAELPDEVIDVEEVGD